MRDIWRRALEEHTTPGELATSVGIGVLVGATPLYGFHAFIAIGLATVFRVNRLWAFLGSRISIFPISPWIMLAEIQLAHRVRTGSWAPVLDIVHDTPDEMLSRARDWTEDWILGTLPVGAALAFLLGGLAYAIARYRVRRRTLARPREPSSGSRP